MSQYPNQPNVQDHLQVSYPAPKVLQLQLSRPKQLNAMTDELEADLCRILDWFENEPSLWVVIITGEGRAFCAGQDLKAWNSTAGAAESGTQKILNNPHGFGSIARRRSKKVFIAALNGMCFGGGAELAFNCDLVIAGEGVKVGFPEVQRGVVAAVGGIPNLLLRSPQLVPYLLTGLPIPLELLKAHLFTSYVPLDQVLPTALDWAAKIVACSPDAVQVTKDQIEMYKEGKGMREIVYESMKGELANAMYAGENLKEGLRSFVEKRQPNWADPKPSTRSKL